MLFIIFLLASPFYQVSSQVSETSSPDITIKYSSGDELLFNSPSPSTLHISKEGSTKGPVELICVAHYPITWDYVIEDNPMSLRDMVEYQRQVFNPEKFRDPRENRFIAKFTLWKLFESQTGQYVCHNFSSSEFPKTTLNLFISGSRTFNTITNSIKILNENATHGIFCPVTNPKFKVTLNKLINEKWEEFNSPMVVKHDPIFGFRFLNTTSYEDRLGKYKCVAETAANVYEKVNIELTENITDVEAASNQIACRGNQALATYFRSAWLEFQCDNSFAFFQNANGTTSWRVSSAKAFDPLNFTAGGNASVCEDKWSLYEYAMNFNETEEICFSNAAETPTLTAFGKKFNSEQDNETYTLLSVEYNGKWNEAGGNFILAITPNGSMNSVNSAVEYLHNIEPQTRYFPLASQQAIWTDVRINGTNIANVTVFQPAKDSFEWIPLQAGAVLEEHVSVTNSGNLLTKTNFSLLALLLFSYSLSS